MKRVLILSVFTFPANVIASYRTMAYLKHFQKFGIEPTVLSNAPEANNRTGSLLSAGIVGVRGTQTLFTRALRLMERFSVTKKMSILIRWSLGYLDQSIHDIEMYFAMKAYVQTHSKDIARFDCIIGIFSPHHHLRLSSEISKEYRIPFVLDFRDLWHNRIIQKDYQPDRIERLQDLLSRCYWRKWLKRASFFTITSEAWRAKINEFSDTKGYIITNGFDTEAFALKLEVKTSEFVVAHVGSLYEHQKLDIFLEGCRKFVQKEKPLKFKVKFIGGDRKGGLKGKKNGFMIEPKQRILEVLSPRYCEVTKRISKEAAIEEMKNSQLLLFPAFPDSPGTHLGKIFDYLGARRNILVVPDDNGVIGELVTETQTGVIASMSEEVAKILKTKYQEWQQTGSLKYFGDSEKIDQYSREGQVKKMTNYLNRTLS